MRNQKGFGVVEGLLIIAVVMLSVFGGYYVWSQNRNSKVDKQKDNNGNSSYSEKQSSTVVDTLTEYSEDYSPKFLNNDDTRKYVSYYDESSETDYISFKPTFFAHYDNRPTQAELKQKLKDIGLTAYSPSANPYGSEYYANSDTICDLSVTDNSSSSFYTLTCIERVTHDEAIDSVDLITDAIESFKNLSGVNPIGITWENNESGNLVKVYYSSNSGFNDNYIYLSRSDSSSEWVVVKEEPVAP